MKAKFLTPVITVFDDTGALDREGNKKLWDNIINNGIDGIVILGSTGEFFSMTLDEKKEYIEFAADYIDGRVELLVGTGCENVEDTVALSNYALDKGANGVMIVSPYYFSLSQESIELFYDTIAPKIKGDIYLYNYPERTVHDISPQTTLNLVRKHKNIIGFKDSVGGMSHTRELIDTVKSEYPDFIVYCGLDENFAHNILSGGDGTVGGLSNVLPRLCADWVKAINCNDMEKVSWIQKTVNKAVKMYATTTPYIPAVKTAAMLLGITDNDHCRAPIISSDKDQKNKIKKIFEELGYIG